MNSPIALLLAAAFAINACGQDRANIDVPAPVKSAFTNQFPKAEGMKWGLEDKTDYEVDFKLDGMKYSALYAPNGTWKETEHKVKVEALPPPVRATLARDFADHKVEGAEMAETPTGTVYEVDMEKGEQDMEVVFHADGTVLKTVMEQDQDDHDDEKD